MKFKNSPSHNAETVVMLGVMLVCMIIGAALAWLLGPFSPLENDVMKWVTQLILFVLFTGATFIGAGVTEPIEDFIEDLKDRLARRFESARTQAPKKLIKP